MKHVKVNHVYLYDPAMYDQLFPCTGLKKGDQVRVVNLPGCPPANTMGHCHVADPETGTFLGLVQTASLESIPYSPQPGDAAYERLKAKLARLQQGRAS